MLMNNLNVKLIELKLEGRQCTKRIGRNKHVLYR